MAAITSNGTGGGNWSDTATWTGGVVPGEGDTVTIQSTDTVTIDDSAAATITVGDDTATDAISVIGDLRYLSTATVDHILVLKGDIEIDDTGILQIGTSANPIPSTRTFTIKLNYSATLSAVEFGLNLFLTGEITMFGGAKTTRTVTTTAITGGSTTVFTVNDATGWKVNDVILVGSTQAQSQYETRTIQQVNGNEITVTSAFTNTHAIGAKVGMLTHNLKITAYDASYNGFVHLEGDSLKENFDYVEFSELGNSTVDKYGIDIDPSDYGINLDYCSIYNCYYGVMWQATGYFSSDFSITNNVFYNLNSYALSTTNQSIPTSITNNFFCKGAYAMYWYCNNGDRMMTSLDYSGNWFDSYTSIALDFYGFGSYEWYIKSLLLDDCDFMFCTVGFDNDRGSCNLYAKNAKWTGGTTNIDRSGMVSTTEPWFSHIELFNCLLGGTTEISTISSDDWGNTYAFSMDHDQIVGSHKYWRFRGIISSDTTIYRTASPSERLTPNNASNKLVSNSFKVNVNSGQTCTPSVYVRESVVGDGTDYNGNRIRLILKKNDAIGITADTVIDTATASSEGAFEQLTGTTAAASADGVMEFIIDGDGTTGWINVDDFSATVA